MPMWINLWITSSCNFFVISYTFLPIFYTYSNPHCPHGYPQRFPCISSINPLFPQPAPCGQFLCTPSYPQPSPIFIHIRLSAYPQALHKSHFCNISVIFLHSPPIFADIPPVSYRFIRIFVPKYFCIIAYSVLSRVIHFSSRPPRNFPPISRIQILTIPRIRGIIPAYTERR